jgi:7-keto-8-aminopelargonate synthetase-like enzyme
VPAIRYPTVAKGAARLRVTVTAAHTELQIAALGTALVRHARVGSDETAVPV